MTVTDEQVVLEKIRIDSTSGKLEGQLAYFTEGQPRYAVVLAGPHPYMGGEIENNVLQELAGRIAADSGLAVSFNYSGAGESSGQPIDVAKAMQQFWETGHAPQDQQLVHDTAAALQYASQLEAIPFFALGYSFGCWTIVKNLETCDPKGVILVSPTISRHDFSCLPEADTPICVIFGEKDFLVSAERMNMWIDSLPGVRRRHCMSASEHFFRNREAGVAEFCRQFIKECLT